MPIYISFRGQIVLQALSRESAQAYIARQEPIIRAQCDVVETRKEQEESNHGQNSR